MKQEIKVSVRIKPLTISNQKSCLSIEQKELVLMQSESDSIFSLSKLFSPLQSRVSSKRYNFDYLFDEKSAQIDIFQIVKPLLDQYFLGINATIMVYGQTSSGKSYTMGTLDDTVKFNENNGIIPRALESIFNIITNDRRASLEKGVLPRDYSVSLQAVELYQDDFIDLLDPKDKSNLVLRETEGSTVELQGVTKVEIKSAEEALAYLRIALNTRRAEATKLNESSSRSHAIFTLYLVQTWKSEGSSSPTSRNSIITSKFNFVDLAGTERLKKTSSIGERQKEGISINQGLLVLGKVINSLSTNNMLPPYRESKLTRYLKDALGGNSETLIITCVNQNEGEYYETLNALNFAQRAKSIINDVRVNIEEDKKGISYEKSKELQRIIDKLEKELESRKLELIELDKELEKLKFQQESIVSLMKEPFSSEEKLKLIKDYVEGNQQHKFKRVDYEISKGVGGRILDLHTKVKKYERKISVLAKLIDTD